jgi:L-amino acid N-acyltransferase YncA
MPKLAKMTSKSADYQTVLNILKSEGSVEWHLLDECINKFGLEDEFKTLDWLVFSEKEEVVVLLGAMREENDTLYEDFFESKKSQRGRGYGYQAIRELIAYAERLGCKYLYGDYIEGASQHIHKKLGFQVSGETPFKIGDYRELRMGIQLPKAGYRKN